MKTYGWIVLLMTSLLLNGLAYAGSCDGPLNVIKKRLASNEQLRFSETYQYEGLEQLNREGKLIGNFSSRIEPLSGEITKAIEAVL